MWNPAERSASTRAAAAEAARIRFIGPGRQALEMAGNKVAAKEHAIAAGVPGHGKCLALVVF